MVFSGDIYFRGSKAATDHQPNQSRRHFALLVAIKGRRSSIFVQHSMVCVADNLHTVLVPYNLGRQMMLLWLQFESLHMTLPVTQVLLMISPMGAYRPVDTTHKISK